MTTPTGVSTTLDQFEANGALVCELFAGVPEARLRERRLEGKWSALENLAHLGRFHETIRERVGLMTGQDNPTFARSEPDTDPLTKVWMDKPAPQLLSDFAHERARLLAELRALPEGVWSRTGTHTAFGSLTLAQWLDFWQMHDGHHIMTAFVRARS